MEHIATYLDEHGCIIDVKVMPFHAIYPYEHDRLSVWGYPRHNKAFYDYSDRLGTTDWIDDIDNMPTWVMDRIMKIVEEDNLSIF